MDLLNPLQGKFALKDYAEAFKKSQRTQQKVFHNKFIIV